MELHQAFAEKVAQRAVLIISVIVIVIFLMLLLRSIGALEFSRLRLFVESTGAYSPLVLIAIIIIGGVLFIPATPAIIVSGALYGAMLGGVYAYIGVMLSASLAFLIARYFRSSTVKMLGKHSAVLAQFKDNYLEYAIFLTRAIPVFHFEIVSYASGLTSVSYLRFIAATGLGILVPITFFTMTGKGLMNNTDQISIFAAVLLVLFLFLLPMAIDHYNPFGWKQKLLQRKTITKKK